MNNEKLYSEVKQLLNISDEAFNIYRDLKSRTYEEDGEILILHINRKEAEKHFKKGRLILQDKAKYNPSKLEIYCKDRTMKFDTLNNISTKLHGRRIKEIRFWN